MVLFGLRCKIDCCHVGRFRCTCVIQVDCFGVVTLYSIYHIYVYIHTYTHTHTHTYTHIHIDTYALTLTQGVKEEHVAKAVEECMRVVTLTQYADRTVQVHYSLAAVVVVSDRVKGLCILLHELYKTVSDTRGIRLVESRRLANQIFVVIAWTNQMVGRNDRESHQSSQPIRMHWFSQPITMLARDAGMGLVLANVNKVPLRT